MAVPEECLRIRKEAIESSITCVLQNAKRLRTMWASLVDQKVTMVCILERLPLSFSYAVVDLETTGLDPVVDEIVAFGLVYDSYLLGCVRVYEDSSSFKALVRDIVERLLRDGVDVYAWFKRFEEEWLGLHGLKELQLREYEKKDASLSLGIELVVDGRSVPRLWHRWLRYRDFEALLRILWRATYDAYIEAVSVYRRRFLEVDPLEIDNVTVLIMKRLHNRMRGR